MKDSKIKGLRPTMRIKKRFLLVKIISDEVFEFSQISYAINQQLLQVLGSHQYGELGIWLLKEQFNKKEQQIILKTTPQGVEKIIAVLSLGVSINSKKARAKTLNVSGTLKGVRNNFEDTKD